jgi:hypothetical protein
MFWCLLCTSCASPKQGASPSPEHPLSITEGKALSRELLPDDGEVTLLDAGAEPRDHLRYQLPKGQAERLVIQLGLSSLLESPEASLKLDDVVLELALNIGSTYELEDDLWACPIRFEVAGLRTPEAISEEQRAMLIEQIAPLSLVSGVFEIDAQGLMHDAVLTVPPEVPPRLLAAIANVRTSLVTAPFPLERVGVGARWEVQHAFDIGPMEVRQVVNYTLLGRDGSALRIGLTVHQSAHPQELFLDGQGTKLSVQSYEVSSVGSSFVDLHAIAPLGALRGSSELRATLHRGGQDEAIALSGAMFVNVASGRGLEELVEHERAP